MLKRLCAAALALTAFGLPARAADDVRVYLGTYTGKGSKGIYLSTLDPATGKLSPPALAGEVDNPSFLAVHPSKKFLYAIGEVSNFGGKKAGAVSAFAVDPATGKLTLLNQQASGGAGPCFVTVDAAGKNALVANYGGGSVACLPIGADGKLAPASSVVQHAGRGPTPRQAGPNAHSINLDKANRFAVACDLGIDKVLVYKFDAAAGTLTPNDPAGVAAAPAAGPRHFAFHPDGKHAFVINEINSTLTAYAYDAEKGTLAETDTKSTLANEVKGNSTAEVVVHPSGRWVFGSNRGHNSIAAFGFDVATGKLTPAGHTPTGGKTPRNFNVDPTGKWLLAANQDSGTVAVFRIDAATGKLEAAGEPVAVPSPVCVRFVVP